jgi:DNA-binding MarR family transcriptional regulator
MDYKELAHEVIMEIIRHSPRERFKKTDEITHGEIKMLGYLCITRDGVTAGELSEKMNISTARVATLLKNLEKKGIIRRTSDARDKRKVVVLLTPEGRALGREKYEKLLGYLSELFGSLGERDTMELIRLMKRVAAFAEELNRKEEKEAH